MCVVNISRPDEIDDRGVHCVGAWPKGITVGNWRLCSTIINSVVVVVVTFFNKTLTTAKQQFGN